MRMDNTFWIAGRTGGEQESVRRRPDGCEMRLLRYCRSLLFRNTPTPAASRARVKFAGVASSTMAKRGFATRHQIFNFERCQAAHRSGSHNRPAARWRAIRQRIPGGCRMAETPDRQVLVLALESRMIRRATLTLDFARSQRRSLNGSIRFPTCSSRCMTLRRRI